MEKAKGGTPHKKSYRSNDATGRTQTLSDLGITKDHSSQWQQLADVPEEVFERELAEPSAPTTSGVTR